MGEQPTPHPGGRPLKFQSVEELDQKIDEYFESRAPHVVKMMVKRLKADGTHYWAEDEDMSPQLPVHISGLAVFLGTTRKTLLNYKAREEFLPSIEYALARCEEYAADMLSSPYANGMKFNLQNNHGWEDRSIRENEGGFFDTGKLKVEVVKAPDNSETADADPTPPAERDAEPSASATQ